MNNNVLIVESLFKNAISLEKTAETLYRQYEEMFSHCPEVANFWKNYANEENGHAKFIERIFFEVDKKRLSEPADIGIAYQLQASINRISKINLENIKTLDDAYQLAVEIENTETNAIFEFIFMNFSNEELAKSRNFLRAQLRDHIDKLETNFPIMYKNASFREKCLVKKINKSKFSKLFSLFFPHGNIFIKKGD